MRKESDSPAARAARRRLELLGRELADAGLAPDQQPDQQPLPDGTTLVLAPGRHAFARSRRGWQDRVVPGLSLGPTHLGVLAVVVSAGLAVTAWVALRSAPHEVAAPVAHTSPAAHAVVPGAPGVVTPAASADPSAGVVVDVAGKVRHPGVATLPAGSRVIDAIRHAGGTRRGVDLTGLNLARVLTDGEQVLVGEQAAGGAAASSGPVADGALVNLNTAGLEQLDGLPGVGPVTAQKILDWRTGHGSFTSVDDLLEVPGIGDKTLADIAPHVTL
ncbi:MAG: helix-hairpin-helix domain-containing protein [Marmoricola sp.]